MHLCKIKYLKRKDDMESMTTKIYTISIMVDLIIRSRKTLSTFKNSNIYNITVKKFGKQKSIFMLYSDKSFYLNIMQNKILSY